MKKIKHIVASLLASSFLLAGCGKEAPCDHKDENNDHVCDLCNEKLSECADENNDHLCDVCGEKLSEHKDENNDHECDVCGEALPYVQSVTISEAPATLGQGSTVELTATVDAKNGAETTVTWSTEDETVKLTANGNTVTVEGTKAGTATIVAKSTVDETVLDSVTIEIITWDAEVVAMMEDYLGETVFYMDVEFEWDDSELSKYGLCAYAAASDLETIVEAFEDNGNWEVVWDEDEEMYVIKKDCENLEGYYIEAWLYEYGDTAYLQFFAKEFPLTEWPADKIDAFLDGITEERPEVLEGDEYTFTIIPEDTEKGTPAYISLAVVGGDAVTYSETLAELGWIVDDSMYELYMSYYGYGIIDTYSPEYSLEVQIIDYGDEVYLAIVPTGLELPEQTAWTEAEQTMMMTYLGEVLPFANCGFTWADYWEEDGALEATSPFPGMMDTMAAVFTEEAGWTTTIDKYGDYTFTKTVGTSLITVQLIDYMSYYGLYLLTATKTEILSDWTDAEKALMETYFGETLPFFPGGFEWTENYYGTGLDSYQDASKVDLEAVYAAFSSEDGWTKTVVDSYEVDFTKLASNKEGYSINVSVTYDDWYDEYAVSAKLVKNPLTAWPAEELATILGDLTEETVPAYPAGEGVTYEISASTISANKANVIITGGDLATYKGILTTAGYSVEADESGYGEFLSPNKTVYIYAEEYDGILYLTIKAQEAPAAEGFDWGAFASSFVVKVKDPNMGGTVSYRFTFDGAGGVTGVDSSTTKAISFTVTMDFVGCSENQVHLTGSDADWNCIDVDIIVETTDGENFSVVSDNSKSNFSF